MGVAHVDRGISYLFSDLRHLPYADGYFDTVASISTLEHVGMDNVGYGADAPRADDPAKEMDLAIRELVRVLRPNGVLLVTVPYGRREDHANDRSAQVGNHLKYREAGGSCMRVKPFIPTAIVLKVEV